MRDDYTPDAALEDIKVGLKLLQEIEADYPESWEKGEDFLVDVREKLEDVQTSIKDFQNVTPGQTQAIQNWCRGIRRWHPQHRNDD
jgi:hypothetical protein